MINYFLKKGEIQAKDWWKMEFWGWKKAANPLKRNGNTIAPFSSGSCPPNDIQLENADWTSRDSSSSWHTFLPFFLTPKWSLALMALLFCLNQDFQD
jgi:hypothetical protein